MTDTEQPCSACGGWIPPRTWFLEIALPRQAAPLIHCAACAVADGATPPDAPWPVEAKPS